MKAWLLIYILEGDPVMLADYATEIECTTILVSVRAASTTVEGNVHRCLKRTDYETALAIADRRNYEIWKLERD